jgi:hypothetical protein
MAISARPAGELVLDLLGAGRGAEVVAPLMAGGIAADHAAPGAVVEQPEREL